MLARPDTTALTVVTPTEHLKHQWARAAHRLGIALDPEYTNSQGQASADFAGVAVTYAQLAAHPARTLGETVAGRDGRWARGSLGERVAGSVAGEDGRPFGRERRDALGDIG